MVQLALSSHSILLGLLVWAFMAGSGYFVAGRRH